MSRVWWLRARWRCAPLPVIPLLLMVASVGGYIEVLEETHCHDTRIMLTCRHLDAQLAILSAAFVPAPAPPSSPPSASDLVLLSPQRLPPPPPFEPSVAAAADVPPDASAIAIASAAEACANADASSAPTVALAASAGAVAAAAWNKSHAYSIRPALNHRCSGVNHCSFILSEDVQEAALWGPGLVYIKYACMQGENTSRSCNYEATVHGEGFLETPGYPQYYIGTNGTATLVCRWRLHAAPGQRLHLRFLDVSLRGASKPLESNCIDSLQVTEDGREVLKETCGEQDEVIEITSEGESLDVIISLGSKTVFPKRGVLLNYRALDCVHPSPPRDGYIIYKNDTYGEYMCCLGFAFPDTHSRHRVLQCINNNTWNNTLPNCTQNIDVYDETDNVIGPMRLNSDINNTVHALELKHSDLMLDVLLPTIIICVLLVGNGVILFVIYYLRKRRLSRNNEEEAGAICQPHDATERAISV